MDWGVGGASISGKERRSSRRSRSRSVESRESYQAQIRQRKRFERERLRSISRSSDDSPYSQQDFAAASPYQSRRKRKDKRKDVIDNTMMPSEVSLDKLTKVMASLVETSSNQQQTSSGGGKADIAPDFDPEDRTVTSETWCRKMDDLKVLFNWSDESTIYFAASKLRGLANAWYNGLPNRQYIWVEFKDRLKSAFPSKRNYYELLLQMMTRKKLGNEKYVTYYYDKLALLKTCNITGEDAVSCIVAGISDQTVRKGAEVADFNGLEALLGYMTAVENVPSSTRDTKYSNKPSTSSGCYNCGMDDHFAHKCPQQSMKKNSNSCYNCGSDGHFAKDCRNMGRCFRCGGNDHFVISCPQSASSAATKVQPYNTGSQCYMCGVEGHIAQYCPDAHKIRSKNCFICHKRGHLAVACPTTKYAPVRCDYCGKVGHKENDCYSKMDANKYAVPPPVRRDPYDVYEDKLLDEDVLEVANKLLPKRQNANGQDEFLALSEGELGSEHSG